MNTSYECHSSNEFNISITSHIDERLELQLIINVMFSVLSSICSVFEDI